jgi:hypothetical protein
MKILSDEFQTELELLGFEHLGSRWYKNGADTIRIRLWKDEEATFWDWVGEPKVVFIGKLSWGVKDVKWILNRCFSNNY